MLVVAWRDPGQTPQHQIDLVQSFADQGAIAIENVRLFNETKESLDRQTATSEILKVISRTTFDLQPVLEIVLANARGFAKPDRRIIFATVTRKVTTCRWPTPYSASRDIDRRGMFERAPISLTARRRPVGRSSMDAIGRIS